MRYRTVQGLAWVGRAAAVAAGAVVACTVTQMAEATQADPEAVAKVLAGDCVTANAGWWGFNGEDATEALQAAINSGASKVVVPYTGSDWIVRPIVLRRNQELCFEPGVVVAAKKGAFKGRGDSLFSASDAENITVRGYGATLRMHKVDYQSDAYEKAEWRMTLDFAGCRQIRVEGLCLESSGGDGIYLGATGTLPYCADVVIRDVVCRDHHRQGISVISAVNLLIENCVLSGTGGTAPEAGIDLEPNSVNEKLVNVVVRNCVMADNEGAGILVYLKNLSRESDPVSVLFENCYVQSGRDQGLAVGAVRDEGATGLVEFRNCTVENTEKGGAYVYDKSAAGTVVRFTRCKWKDTATAPKGDGPRVPLLINLRRDSITKKHGGIEFIDCEVYDSVDRPCLVAEEDEGEAGIAALTGTITVHSPYAARMDVGGAAGQVSLDLR